MSQITLRPFQEHAIDSYRGVFARAKSHLGIAPTAFGKSIFAGVMASRLKKNKNFRTIIIAHREALVSQNADKVRRVDPTLLVGIEKAEQIAEPDSDVISASIQTLHPKRLERCLSAWRGDKRPIYLIIDEAHHALAKSYRELIEAIKPEQMLGLTATPFRKDDSDGSSLRGVFPEVAFNIPRGEMIDDGWLARPRHWKLKTDRSLEFVDVRAGDFVEKDLAKELIVESRDDLIVSAANSAIEELKAQGMHVPRGVCFAINVEHCYKLEEKFRNNGWDAKAIVAETPIEERREWDQKLRNTVLPTILISCGVLTEGWDVEEVNLGLFARPTKSPVLADQMLGRVLRLHPHKPAALCIDFEDAGAERCSIAGSFKLPSGWDADGECLRQDEIWFNEQLQMASYTVRSQLWKCEHRRQVVEIMEKRCLDAGPVLIEDRGWMWWDLGPELRLVVENSCIVVEQTPLGDFSVTFRKGTITTQIETCAKVTVALSKAESWLAMNFGEISGFLKIGRADDERPVSEGQKLKMKRMGIEIPKGCSIREARILINAGMMEVCRDLERGRVGFGKYKGAEIARLPDHYLKWAVAPEQHEWMGRRPEYSMFLQEMENRGLIHA